MAKQILRPKNLQIGEIIGIVSTARKITKEDLTQAIRIFEGWGLKVKIGKSVGEAYHQFAGNDNERLLDFQDMIDDPIVKAIICAKGGYGTSRIIDRINFSAILQNPKWIAGFSDVTVLLSHLNKLGIECIHSTMPLLFGRDHSEKSIQSLRDSLFGKQMNIAAKPNPLNQFGKVSGEILGGNLSILCHLIGTSSEPDYKDKILFLEDVDEYLYHIDRMMVQLKRAGRLRNLKGLVVGYMTDMKDNHTPFGKSACEIIKEHVQDYSFPVGFGFPIGHEEPNIAIPVGRVVQLEVNKEGANLMMI